MQSYSSASLKLPEIFDGLGALLAFLNVRISCDTARTRRSAFVKSFGRREACRLELERGIPGLIVRWQAPSGGGVIAYRMVTDERHASGLSSERHGCDVDEDQAVPGHDGAPVVAEAKGGARGCIQRSKVSMMRIRPPQQGQGGR
jgi:hypothetical protein